jgi:hypothetical protein
LRIKKGSTAGSSSTILVNAVEGWTSMDYNELGEPFEISTDFEPSKAPKRTLDMPGQLQTVDIIDRSVQQEIFARIQKNLILIKVLAESVSKFGNSLSKKSGKENDAFLNFKESAELQHALAQIKASQRRISSIFSPLALQLFPEQVEPLLAYTVNITMICAGNQELPSGLFDDIELPTAQKRVSFANESATGGNLVRNGVGVDERKESVDRSAYFISKEYHLFLASIYLSEALENMEKAQGHEASKLVKVVRPEVMALENACSKIHNIFSKGLERDTKWSWRSSFRTN